MEKMDLFSILFILACLHVHSVRSAIGTSEINCSTGTNSYVDSVLEEYEGDVEMITNIGPDDRLELEGYFDPIGVTFLELDYTNGESTATVRTKKPLDADKLKETGGNLYYSVTCLNTGMKNIRSVNVQDVNDSPPIFQSKSYSATVSEMTAVGSDVLRVTGEDADVLPENNNITYSILINVKQSIHRDSVTVISLNLPVYIVGKKIPEMENSMKKVLGWTVKILGVRAEDGIEMRTVLRNSTAKTYISFIAMDSNAVIQATEVKEKLNSENNILTSELEKIFGPGLEIKVEDSSGNSKDRSQAVTITLSVLLAISIVVTLLLSAHLVKGRRDCLRRTSSMDNLADFYINPESRG